MFNDAQNIIEKLNYNLPGERLSLIASTLFKWGEITKNKAVINESFAMADKIDVELYRYEAFKAMTESRLFFEDIHRLRMHVSNLSEESRGRMLARILTVYSHPELAKE